MRSLGENRAITVRHKFLSYIVAIRLVKIVLRVYLMKVYILFICVIYNYVALKMIEDYYVCEISLSKNVNLSFYRWAIILVMFICLGNAPSNVYFKIKIIQKFPANHELHKMIHQISSVAILWNDIY